MLRQTTRNLITAFYPRLSHEDELQGESNSISNQKRILKPMRSRTAFPICNGTQMTVILGRLPKTRFSAACQDIEAGKVGTVIAGDMSRLGTKLSASGNVYGNDFPQKGVRFIAINDGGDSAQGDNDFAPLAF